MPSDAGAGLASRARRAFYPLTEHIASPQLHFHDYSNFLLSKGVLILLII